MNRLVPFKLPQRGVRGFAVELSDGLTELTQWHAYPDAVFTLLAQALAAAPMLAADLNQDFKFNLQFNGTSSTPITLLVAQVSPQADGRLHVRGMARAKPEADGDFLQLLRGGTLACLIEPLKPGAQRYQAVVEIAGEDLSEALQIYFGQSEQLPTRIKLAASRERVVGLFLQRLPEGGSDDDWVHVHHLVNTLRAPEHLSISLEQCLQRLFAEDEVRLFAARAIDLSCTCSHAQISNMLLGLGEEELAPVLTAQGRIDVTCEYCGKQYGYTDLEVRSLFAAAQQTPDGATVQ